MNRRLVGGIALLAVLCGQAAEAPRAMGFGYLAQLNGASQNPPTGSSGKAFAAIVFDGNVIRIGPSFFSGIDYSDLTGSAVSVQLHGPTATSGLLGSGIQALESAKAASVANVPPATAPWLLPGGASGNLPPTVVDLTQPSAWDPAYLAAHGGSTAAATADLYSGLATIGPNAGKVYVSINTTAFPDGEIRGFLSGFPEPASGTLAALGLAGASALRRRRT